MLWHLCQSTLSRPHQIQWVWVHFCCSSNSLLLGTDVIILQHYLRLLAPCCNPTNHQANAIQGWIHPSSIQIPQYDSYIYDGGALILNKSMETGQTCESLCGNYTEHVKQIGPTKVLSVWWLLRWSFYKRQFSSEMEEIIWQYLFLFERDNLGTLLKRNSSPSKWTNWGTFFVGWWNGDTYWDWLEACWRVFNGGSPL